VNNDADCGETKDFVVIMILVNSPKGNLSGMLENFLCSRVYAHREFGKNFSKEIGSRDIGFLLFPYAGFVQII